MLTKAFKLLKTLIFAILLHLQSKFKNNVKENLALKKQK